MCIYSFFQFDAEFRRFSLAKDVQNPKFDDFYKMLENMHRLANIPFLICYTDPNGDLLPINNDDNYRVALCTAKPMLRLLVQKKGKKLLLLTLEIEPYSRIYWYQSHVDRKYGNSFF